MLTPTQNITSLLPLTSTSVCKSKLNAHALRHSLWSSQVTFRWFFFTKKGPGSVNSAALFLHQELQPSRTRVFTNDTPHKVTSAISQMFTLRLLPLPHQHHDRFVSQICHLLFPNVICLSKADSPTAQTGCWKSPRATLASMTVPHLGPKPDACCLAGGPLHTFRRSLHKERSFHDGKACSARSFSLVSCPYKHLDSS